MAYYGIGKCEMLRGPDAIYVDWMHTWCASGGIAQYGLNGYVQELAKHGVTTEDIDSWMAHVKCPKGLTRLGNLFVSERCRKNAGAHIKAFAAEVLRKCCDITWFVH